MGIIVAIRSFWGALTDREMNARLAMVLADFSAEQCDNQADYHCEKVDPNVTPGRSDAFELLSALQREARFIDFIKESLAERDDATVGAAARAVHDRCSIVLERCFEIRSLTNVQEGELMTLSREEAGNRTRVQFTNRTHVAASISGRVIHAGWIAKKFSIPHWSGSKDDESVLAPIIVEN